MPSRSRPSTLQAFARWQPQAGKLVRSCLRDSCCVSGYRAPLLDPQQPEANLELKRLGRRLWLGRLSKCWPATGGAARVPGTDGLTISQKTVVSQKTERTTHEIGCQIQALHLLFRLVVVRNKDIHLPPTVEAVQQRSFPATPGFDAPTPTLGFQLDISRHRSPLDKWAIGEAVGELNSSVPRILSSWACWKDVVSMRSLTHLPLVQEQGRSFPLNSLVANETNRLANHSRSGPARPSQRAQNSSTPTVQPHCIAERLQKPSILPCSSLPPTSTSSPHSFARITLPSAAILLHQLPPSLPCLLE